MSRRIALLITVGMLLLAVALELVARFGLGLGHPPLSQPHPTIEYLFKPDQDVMRFGNHFRTNRYGMRSDDFPPRRATPDELRVMIYGDSVINGGNLTDQAALATTLLQAKLRAALHRPVIVGNVSAGSWGPPNQLAYVRQFGFLDADVVVLVLSSHDFADAPTFAPLNPLTHPTEEPWSAAWEGFERYLPRYLGGSSGPAEPPAGPAAPDKVNPRDIEVSLTAERELLQMAQRLDVPTILVQHWTVPEIDSAQAEAGHDALRQVAEQLGVPVRDDFEALRELRKARRNPLRDDIHPNETGQAALAELLLSALEHDVPADILHGTRHPRAASVW